MHGLHLIADLHHCQCPVDRLLDCRSLEIWCSNACQRHGLTVVGCLFHQFVDCNNDASGVTGAIVLAESHLTVHTWPELCGVTLDLYVCNFSADNSASARALADELIAHFDPQTLERKEVARGHLSN